MSWSNIDWVQRAQSLDLRVQNVIDGHTRSADGDESLKKYSPRDGRLLCRSGAGHPRDVEEAVRAARQSFEDGRWSKLPVPRRKEVLLRLAALIEKHAEELALLESIDVGKPIRDAVGFDVPTAAASIRYSAEAADKLHSRVYSVDPTSLSYQLRRPIGVVAGIIGWNFPIVLAAEKIGPALATGNSLVLKPSELTCFTAPRFAELALEAGVPEGVLNVITGAPTVGAALAQHRDVDLVTFTGSSRTGKKLLVAAGESNMKRLILECGGKAPNIVFDDCPDLEAVADAVVARAFWNQGQVCTASSRLLVHQAVKDALAPIITRKVSALQPGDPLKPDTTFGALISLSHRQKVLGYIESAERESTRIVYRSAAPAPFEGGFYVPPVIFDEVSSHQKIAQEEIFGPVLSVMSFSDEEEAIRIANATVYGLSAILWTRDLGRAHRMTQAIRAGWVVVHATNKRMGGPGPGVLSIGGHKESGIGVEGGLEGLEGYLSRTAVQFFV
jgi:acyl-CoA reductase-like NAD-dependent aldehyde dehydrogenase